MIIKLEQFKKGKIYRAQAISPYDGCMSEPVYAYATEDGEADFLCYGKEKDWSHRMLESVNDAFYHPWERDTIDEFDYKYLTELFNSNPEHAVSVAKTVVKRHGIGAECKCPKCECMKPLDEFEPNEGSLQGLGGIASMYTNWYCVECMMSNTCEYCGYLAIGVDECLDEDGYCEKCRQRECAYCGDEHYTITFDKYGVCSDCQKEELYLEQKDKYNQLVKQIKYENKNQLRFDGIEPKPVPEFVPISKEEYMST